MRACCAARWRWPLRSRQAQGELTPLGGPGCRPAPPRLNTLHPDPADKTRPLAVLAQAAFQYNQQRARTSLGSRLPPSSVW